MVNTFKKLSLYKSSLSFHFCDNFSPTRKDALKVGQQSTEETSTDNNQSQIFLVDETLAKLFSVQKQKISVHLWFCTSNFKQALNLTILKCLWDLFKLKISIVVIFKTDQFFPFQVSVNLKTGLSEEDADILKMVSFYFSKKYGKMLRWRWRVFSTNLSLVVLSATTAVSAGLGQVARYM